MMPSRRTPKGWINSPSGTSCSSTRGKILHLTKNTSMHQYMLGVSEAENSLMEKDLGVLVSIKRSICQKCPLLPKKANCILGYIRQCIGCRSKEEIFPPYSALVRWSSVSSSGLPSIRKSWTY